MAVVTCNIMDDHRADEDDQRIQFIELYRVITDSDTDTPADILNDSNENIPRVGDPHPVNADTIVKNRRVTFTGSRKVYTLEVTYDNSLNAGDPGGGGGGGAVDVFQVTVGAWYEDYIMQYDVNGVPIRNSAGDKIKYQNRRAHPMITVSAQTQAPRMGLFLQNLDRVNDAQVNWLNGQLIFLENQLLFDSYNAQSIGNNTWREDFVFKAKLVVSPTNDTAGLLNVEGKGAGNRPPQIRNAGWQPYLLDAGYFEVWIEAGEKVKRPIRPLEKDGGKVPTQPVTTEWPLDSGGGALTREQVEEGKVFYRNFKVKEKFNFNVFNFDFTQVLTDKNKA
jgi:hypothetical protein